MRVEGLFLLLFVGFLALGVHRVDELAVQPVLACALHEKSTVKLLLLLLLATVVHFILTLFIDSIAPFRLLLFGVII